MSCSMTLLVMLLPHGMPRVAKAVSLVKKAMAFGAITPLAPIYASCNQSHRSCRFQRSCRSKTVAPSFNFESLGDLIQFFSYGVPDK